MSRILIVEDDPAILCGLKHNLEFESHQVDDITLIAAKVLRL
jgi:DNA-binding response OmpR family regulator